MKRSIAALCAVLFLAPLTAAAETTGRTTISVNGTGTVALAPDLATVSATIRTNANTANGALIENNAIYDRIVAAVTRLGIARDDVTLVSFNLVYTPPPEKIQPGDNTTYGFNVNRSFAVKVRRLAQAGATIDACVSSGSAQIDGVVFGASGAASARSKALTIATQDAVAQAQTVAAAAHLRIVGPVQITASESDVVPAPMYRIASVVARPTQLDAGTIDVTETVTAAFAAEP
jgi:uncharacterized protein YggE